MRGAEIGENVLDTLALLDIHDVGAVAGDRLGRESHLAEQRHEVTAEIIIGDTEF